MEGAAALNCPSEAGTVLPPSWSRAFGTLGFESRGDTIVALTALLQRECSAFWVSVEDGDSSVVRALMS